jgi:hypothetical protein
MFGLFPLPRVGLLGKITIGVCALATYIAFHVDSAMRIFALINLIANFWSLGIMWNYGPGSIGSNYENFVIKINMITSGIGLIFLIILLFSN